MRIGMILSTPIPPQEGIGFYVWNLSQYLAKRGHAVQIITRGEPGKPGREVLQGIQVWRPTFYPVYPFHVHLHGVFVDRLVRKLEPSLDLLHLHTPLVKRPRSKLPKIVTLHTVMKADVRSVAADTLLGGLIKLQALVSFHLEQGLFDEADRLVAVAGTVAEEANAYAVPPGNVKVLGNGVDTGMFSPSQNGRNGHSPYALAVARLAPRKGLADLIQCAEIVVRQVPDFKFLIAGSGPFEADLTGEIDRRGLAHSVILLGHIADRARLIDLYRNATVFIHPAHYEGLPTVLLEAMACGCPVVATAVSGALDVVEPEGNGLLVPVRSHEKMAQAILRLCQDTALSEKLGCAGRATVEKRYSWDVVGSNYLTQYRDMLSGDGV